MKPFKQLALFPEPARPKRAMPPHSGKQLDTDDALDAFMTQFRWKFGRDWHGGIPAAMRVIRWADLLGLSLGELIRRAPRIRTEPERYFYKLMTFSDVETQEKYQEWLRDWAERRLRARGGNPLTLGAILEMSKRVDSS